MIPWKELQQKDGGELDALLRTWKNELRALRFSVAQGQLKNVRAIRVLRTQIAQTLTLIQQKKSIV